MTSSLRAKVLYIIIFFYVYWHVFLNLLYTNTKTFILESFIAVVKHIKHYYFNSIFPWDYYNQRNDLLVWWQWAAVFTALHIHNGICKTTWAVILYKCIPMSIPCILAMAERLTHPIILFKWKRCSGLIVHIAHC